MLQSQLTLKFNLDQLNVGREAFVNMLASSLEGQEGE